MRRVHRLFLIFSLCFVISSSGHAMEHESNKAVVMIEVQGQMDEVIKKVKKLVPSGRVGYRYKHVFAGFSFHLPKSELSKIKDIAGVTHIHRAATYAVSVTKSAKYIGSEKIRSYFDSKGNRLTGRGIKVAVIDTGIDYTHRDLRNRYKGGRDFIDNDNDPMETRSLGSLNTLHGTHVAGIIAGNGKIRGVAPEADIYAYRALGPGGRGTSEQVIAAIDQAVEDGMDVINLSLGNPVNGPDWPTSIALNKAAEHGVVAVTSSGNSGPGVWTVGSPGTATKAISVGASYPPTLIPKITITPKQESFPILPLHASIPWEITRNYEIVDGGLGYEKDLNNCNGKVVLVERGIIPFTQKVKAAAAKGAVAVIIYNNEEGNFQGALEDEISIPSASIARKDGLAIKRRILKGRTWLTPTYELIEDQLASFSSRGPVTHSWEIKPDIVAPGVQIVSTVPDGYEPLDGTSMASPHIAGAAAVLKQAHPNWTPEQLKAAMMNTAKILTNDEGVAYPPYEQGAGRIQLQKAIETSALIYPSTLHLGKVDKNKTRTKRTLSLMIENNQDQSLSLTFMMPKNKAGISWHLPLPMTLKPNEKVKVPISLDLTPAVLKEGLHHGNITVFASSQVINLPYLFVVNEPNYPRLSNFSFGLGDKEGTFQYEVYLPRGADEFGILLYEPETLRFIRQLDYAQNVERGLRTISLSRKQVGINGSYRAIIFAKKANKESVLETLIHIY